MKLNEIANKIDAELNKMGTTVTGINSTARIQYVDPWWNNPWKQTWDNTLPWKQDWNKITYPNTIDTTTLIATITKDTLKKKLEQAKIKVKRAQLELELAQLELDEFEINNKENVKA